MHKLFVGLYVLFNNGGHIGTNLSIATTRSVTHREVIVYD